MTTTTDINSMHFHSSTRMNEDISQSLMEIDDPPITEIRHGHSSSNIEQEDVVFHQGNPVLNKSYDVKDDQEINSNVLDTTVELPNSNDVLDEKPTHELNILKPVNNIESPLNSLPNQFSLEYPYELPAREENLLQSSSPRSMDSLSKSLKSIENPEPQTPTLTNEKPIDTSTFVLKRKERRKAPAPAANENSFNTTIEESQVDFIHKQSSPSIALTNSLNPTRIIECVEQYYRILYRVCEYTEELKQELRLVKHERDQMSEDLINAENAFTDVKKRNEKLKLIINEHKANTETLKRFSEESVRYTEEQKQKYAVLKQHAQEKLNEANGEIERLRRIQASEMEGTQTQLRYAQLRVQSLEQELKSVKQELEQKKRENNELTNICDELLATNKK